MKEKILERFKGTVKAKEDFIADNIEHICTLVESIVAAFNNNNKLLIFGNGGSAADAQHIAAEFVNRFLINRRPLPAIALTTDSSILTSIGNDFSFDEIFSKQIQALGNKGDVALGISTSGNSQNVILAMTEAQKLGLTTAVLTGGGGGQLAKLSDIVLNVPTKFTPYIQETHLWVEHIICEMVDEVMFGEGQL